MEAGPLPTELQTVFDDLSRCMKAISPYNEQIILTGGLASIVYRRLVSTAVAEHRALTTTDIDLVVPSHLVLSAGKGLSDLLKESGFRVWSVGKDEQKVSFYMHERHEPPAPYHVEILTPLDRSGTLECRLVEVQDNLRVQALPFMEILFEQTITVSGSTVPDSCLPLDVRFRVPHPVPYIVQKVLIRPNRREEKRNKDLAYIYDAVLLFHPQWDELARVRRRLQADSRFEQWILDARATLSDLFHSEISEGPIVVRLEYAEAGIGHVPTERGIHRVMEQFLHVVMDGFSG